jgi:Indolepyruvate ferredoxin oxidoreductase, alpha and beta subunits
VADDPGMHSSQGEQDSRALAEFARVPCLEPADQQQAYDMTREAFELSERYSVPVMLRITTRLAHSRSGVETRVSRSQNQVEKAAERWDWTLMPQASRRLWKESLASYEEVRAAFEREARIEGGSEELAVITAGLGLEYYKENEEELAQALGSAPAHLHIGRYPLPYGAMRELCAQAKRVLVIEEGAPFVERSLRGILNSSLEIGGKESGELPLTGELDPDLVRSALGLKARESLASPALAVPRRPPQLCQGCPHRDSFAFLKEALEAYPQRSVNGDIGCYTLGALQPFELIESAVDMGASIGMARGAAEAGLKPAVAVIGDSTFYHSGITNLIDAAAHRSSLTVLILDNATTGMTGAQPTILPSERLKAMAIACGVEAEHVVELQAVRGEHEANVAALKKELDYEGPSVVISSRPCIEALKKARKA